jgi:hypothetical protein
LSARMACSTVRSIFSRCADFVFTEPHARLFHWNLLSAFRSAVADSHGFCNLRESFSEFPWKNQDNLHDFQRFDMRPGSLGVSVNGRSGAFFARDSAHVLHDKLQYPDFSITLLE